MYALHKIHDKYNRLETVCMNGDGYVKDETLIDTLKDLANYSIMFINEYYRNE